MDQSINYDPSNIFAKILVGQIPCKKIFENDFALAFHDLYPKAVVHALIIPKGPYINAHHFHENAPQDMIVGFYTAQAIVVQMLNLKESGYRLVSNAGVNAHQEVPHYHVHILGGESLGPINSKHS